MFELVLYVILAYVIGIISEKILTKRYMKKNSRYSGDLYWLNNEKTFYLALSEKPEHVVKLDYVILKMKKGDYK